MLLLIEPFKQWFVSIYRTLNIFCVGRYLASDFPHLAAPPEAPEWWKTSFGGAKVSYGKKTSLSIVQQRQNLPIFKLKSELGEVCNVIW